MKDIIYRRFSGYRVRSEHGMVVTDFADAKSAIAAFPEAVFFDKTFEPLAVLDWLLLEQYNVKVKRFLTVLNDHFQDRFGEEPAALLYEAVTNDNVDAAWNISNFIVPAAKIWCEEKTHEFIVSYWYGEYRGSFNYMKRYGYPYGWSKSKVILRGSLSAYLETMTYAEQSGMQDEDDIDLMMAK